ncbi:MAG: hypothetical protein HY291_07800 [Planctomycetes bacterium]|nr:hypothetical protein [Planctomycetota bacterium]
MRAGMIALLALFSSWAAAAERTVVNAGAANLKVTHSSLWKRNPAARKGVALSLERGGNVIILFSGESNATPEAQLDAYENEVRPTAEKFKNVKKELVEVGPARGYEAQYQFEKDGVKALIYVTVFTHQGMAYRLVGVQQMGIVPVEPEYLEVRASLQFLRDRREWLDKFEGKPAPTALAGGLLTYTLNRPRWMETTFDKQQAYEFIETASYKFMLEGAWVDIRLRKSLGDPRADLEALKGYIASFYQNATVRQAEYQGAEGRVPGYEIEAVSGPYTRLVRLATLSAGNVTMQVWLESLRTLQETTLGDWEKLLAGLRLRDATKPGLDLAYPIYEEDEPQAANPALETVLAKAARVLPESAGEQVLGMSGDGAKALVSNKYGVYLVAPASGKRSRLALDPIPKGNVCWSQDGQRIAYAAAQDAVVATLEPLVLKKVPAKAEDVGWGPGADQLYVVENVFQDRMNNRFTVQRLALLDLDKHTRTTVLEYPLARIGHPALAPDGKTLALACNRDLPRTKGGSQLFVCAPDGTGLRRLGEGRAFIDALAWAPDGAGIYAVQSAATDEQEWSAEQKDVCVFDPKGGKPNNLTRSGHISKVWCLGGDVYLEAKHWDLPASQQGVFRMAAQDLVQAAQGLPEPAAHGAKNLREAVERAVKEAAGGKDLKKFKPSPESMRQIGDAFAGAIQSQTGLKLDFSAGSLRHLHRLIDRLDSGEDDLSFLIGLGAYYGETLRRCAGAEWAIRPEPFGNWKPGTDAADSPYAQIVLPFSHPYLIALGSENAWVWSEEQLNERDEGSRLLLVYPPSHQKEAVKAAEPSAYREAFEKLDRGDVKDALDLLAEELRRFPKNGRLAREAIALCNAAGSAEAAKDLTRRALEAGNQVPELLVRYADALAKDEPAQALEFYKRAAHKRWPLPDVLFKLGKTYAALGKADLAEACWRKAQRRADKNTKQEILALMGLAAPAAAGAQATDDEPADD